MFRRNRAAHENQTFDGGADAGKEQVLFREAELARQAVIVKFHRLNNLHKWNPVWTYPSAESDYGALITLNSAVEYLARRSGADA